LKKATGAAVANKFTPKEEEKKVEAPALRSSVPK
jgi:hypothetical protein